MAIVVDLDVERARRTMSLTELCRRFGVTPANLSVLKNGRARAVRFSTLDALCRALGCQSGNLLRYVADEEAGPAPPAISPGVTPRCRAEPPSSPVGP